MPYWLVPEEEQFALRLSAQRARERRTAQEILTEALRAYLDRAEGRT